MKWSNNNKNNNNDNEKKLNRLGRIEYEMFTYIRKLYHNIIIIQIDARTVVRFQSNFLVICSMNVLNHPLNPIKLQ